jgi:hypothetical protein
MFTLYSQGLLRSSQWRAEKISGQNQSTSQTPIPWAGKPIVKLA